MRDVDFGAERFEALEVQVNGARAPGASAGERYAATSEAGDERAEHVEACAHGLDEFVRGFQMIDSVRVDSQDVASAVDVAADNAEHIGHGLHVFQVRDVCDFGNAIGEECCGHDGKNRVLCARDFDFTVDGCLDLRNDKLIHIN